MPLNEKNIQMNTAKKGKKNQLKLEPLETRVLLSATDLTQCLRITELMYNPAPDPVDASRDLEFIEFQNVGSESIDLQGVNFTNGINFTFTSFTLNAGDFVVVAEDVNDFQAVYGNSINLFPQPYTGSLSNGGERIKMVDAGGVEILDFTYDDKWYGSTDNGGNSLTYDGDLPGVKSDWEKKSNWAPSSVIGGTPGQADTGLKQGDIEFNEILAHSNIGDDFIELINTTSTDINIGGWFLSDDPLELTKYEIPANTILPGNNGLLVFEQSNFGFGISEHGDDVILTSGADGATTDLFSESIFMPASDQDISWGRYFKASTGTYNFTPLQSPPTKGLANNGPLVGPIVISEIMYHPGLEDQSQEYIVITNTTNQVVNLFETVSKEVSEGNSQDIDVGWRFTSGIDFQFATNQTIAANGSIILSRMAENDLRNEFDVPLAYDYLQIPLDPVDEDGVLIVNPDTSFGNSSEKIELSKPGNDRPFGQPQAYIRQDRISYSDGNNDSDFPNTSNGKDPWPRQADGKGASLVRIVDTDYGNDPVNWQASSPFESSNVVPDNVKLTFAPGDRPTQGDVVTFNVTATDADGTIADVQFYLVDENNNDSLLGSGTFANNVWSLQVDTTSFPGGQNSIWALAIDDDGAKGLDNESLRVNASPVISNITVDPALVLAGESFSITSTITDEDDVASVNLFRDTNGNGQVDDGIDQALGAATLSQNDLWSWSGSTSGFVVGENTILIQAFDDNDNDSKDVTLSSTASATVDVFVPNQLPTISSLQALPDPVLFGENVTITASGVSDSDGQVVEVQFYRDANNNNSLDVGIDSLLGSDTDGNDGWELTIASDSFSGGLNRILAIALDNDSGQSAEVTTTVDVNQLPVINDLTIQPTIVELGQDITLTAGSVSDSDGEVIRVNFYLDENNNDSLDEGVDTLLGFDTDGTDGWAILQSTSTFNLGNNTFLAQAIDDESFVSQVVGQDLNLLIPNVPPTINSLLGQPNPITVDEILTLTANNVIDSDGTVSQVEFYLDDGDNLFNSQLDTLLDSDNTGPDYSWSGSTSAFPIGLNRIFVRAQDEDAAWSDIVETTVEVLPNMAPTVDSLTASPDPVIQSVDMLLLTANNVTDADGTVVNSEFYLDDGDQLFDPNVDELLGSDSDESQGWSLEISTNNIDTGQLLLFSRVQDDDGVWSNAVSTTVLVEPPNQLPVIDELINTPRFLSPGGFLRLTANDVVDTDGTIAFVEFYVDSNKNGLLDESSDQLISTDTDGSDGWDWIGQTTGFPGGTVSFFARAQDDEGAWSETVAAQGTFQIASVTLGGDSGFKSLKYSDQDGSDVSVKVGNGEIDFVFDGENVKTISKGSTVTVIGSVTSVAADIKNATEKTSISMSAKGGDGLVELDGITGVALGKLSGKGLILTNNIQLDGSLGSVALQKINPNVIITTGAGAAKGFSLKANEISDGVNFDLVGAVKSFQAAQFGDGVLSADSVGQVKITSANDFSGDIVAKTGGIQGVNATGNITGKLIAETSISKIATKADFKGTARAGSQIVSLQALNLDQAILSAGEKIGKVSLKQDMLDSYIFAGFDLGSDGALGNTQAGGADSGGSGNVDSLAVKGSFARSYVAAGTLPLSPLTQDYQFDYPASNGTIAKVKFGAVDFQANDNFGLYAATAIQSAKIGKNNAQSNGQFELEIIT